MPKSLFSVLIFALASFSVSLAAMSDYSQQKQEADTYYENGNFSSAFKKYKDLARKGDRYSQYRLSYMYLMGEGQKENVIESLAWSVLAAQDKQDEKVAYMKTVAEMVPQDQRKKANKKISYYMRKWGDESGSDSRRSDNECTGSRLCNHKTSASNVGVPSNLWNVSSNDNTQELKVRAQDINESILKAQETSG